MAISTAVARRDTYVNDIGTNLANGSCVILTGTTEATTATADSGTLIVSIPLGATPFNTSSGSGQLVLASPKSANATGVGTNTAGHFRMKSSGAVVQIQGLCGQATTATTSAATAANGDTLTFAAVPSSTVAGARVSGTGIPAGTTVLSSTSTTIVMSQTSSAGVAISTTITVDFDMNLDNPAIANGQNVTLSSFTYTPAVG